METLKDVISKKDALVHKFNQKVVECETLREHVRKYVQSAVSRDSKTGLESQLSDLILNAVQKLDKGGIANSKNIEEWVNKLQEESRSNNSSLLSYDLKDAGHQDEPPPSDGTQRIVPGLSKENPIFNKQSGQTSFPTDSAFKFEHGKQPMQTKSDAPSETARIELQAEIKNAEDIISKIDNIFKNDDNDGQSNFEELLDNDRSFSLGSMATSVLSHPVPPKLNDV